MTQAQEPRRVLRQAVDEATAALTEAGIDSARFDAEEMAAYLAGTDRGRLPLLETLGEGFFGLYDDMVGARSRRVPLQHLIGSAAFGPLTLHVGPGVFIPRPETEAILDWAMTSLGSAALPTEPVIVDLCTGSGALAVALAHHWPMGTVIAVDDSEVALHYARRNADGTSVELVSADVMHADLLNDLTGSVDLLVANPPYIPDGAELEPEVAEHDPHHALFGGPDGMAVVAAVVAHAGRLLRPGGHLAVEHDDTTSAHTVELIMATGLFSDIAARRDLAGRPRFVTAMRRGPS